MATAAISVDRGDSAGSVLRRLNTRWHEGALYAFGAIVFLHWLEHLVQAWQIWGMDLKRPQARGVLGQWFPWLVSSEWLHWGYAVVMVIGLGLLLPGFRGRSRAFWGLAFAIQIWHFVEHTLLFYQAQAHHNFWGAKAPQSVLQHFWFTGSRPELHLLYNSLVTIPMLVGLFFHMYPPNRERVRNETECSCARPARSVMTAAPSPA